MSLHVMNNVYELLYMSTINDNNVNMKTKPIPYNAQNILHLQCDMKLDRHQNHYKYVHHHHFHTL